MRQSSQSRRVDCFVWIPTYPTALISFSRSSLCRRIQGEACKRPMNGRPHSRPRDDNRQKERRYTTPQTCLPVMSNTRNSVRSALSAPNVIATRALNGFG